MRTVRPGGAGTSVLALGMVFWLSGCGGPAEVAKPAAPPVQVQWNRADGTPAEEAPPAGGGDDKIAAGPQEIDLDAPPEPPPRKAEKPARKEEPKPPPPPPEPPAEPTPSPEVEAEAAPEAAPEPPPPPPSSPLDKQIRAAVKSKEKPEPKAPKKRAAPAAPKEAASAYSGPNPCKTKRFSVPRVQAACENGGRQAAKGVMKEAVSKALAGGASLKCGDCHSEQTNYTLKKDAVAQLKKWLGP